MSQFRPRPGMNSCPHCNRQLPADRYGLMGKVTCPACNSDLEFTVYPAFFRSLQAAEADGVENDSEANCFNHPHKQATIICDDCGRFLCAMCDIQIGERHSCPSCIERGRTREEKQELITRRTMYDSIALSLAILPVIVWPVTLFTAPASIFYAIRHWKSPTSILPRTKIRNVFAILIGALQICGWGGFLFSVL